jgi:hypothetical protein
MPRSIRPKRATTPLAVSVDPTDARDDILWLHRSITPKHASYPDLPPENRSSGRSQVSWPSAFGGMDWG